MKNQNRYLKPLAIFLSASLTLTYVPMTAIPVAASEEVESDVTSELVAAGEVESSTEGTCTASEHDSLFSEDYTIDADGNLHFTVYCSSCGTWDSDGENYTPAFSEEVTVTDGNYGVRYEDADCMHGQKIYIWPAEDENYDDIPVTLSNGQEFNFGWREISDDESPKNPNLHESLESKNFSIDEEGNLSFTVYCAACGTWDDAEENYTPVFAENVTLAAGEYDTEVEDANCMHGVETYVCPKTDDEGDCIPVVLSNGQKYSFDHIKVKEENSESADVVHENLRSKDFNLDADGNLSFTVYCASCGLWEETVTLAKGEYKSEESKVNCIGVIRTTVSPLTDDDGNNKKVTLSTKQEYDWGVGEYDDDIVITMTGNEPDSSNHEKLVSSDQTMDEDGNISFGLTCSDCGSSFGSFDVDSGDYELKEDDGAWYSSCTVYFDDGTKAQVNVDLDAATARNQISNNALNSTPENSDSNGKAANFVLQGNASKLSDNYYRLTPLDYNQYGAIWTADSYDTTNGIKVSYDYWAGGGHGNWAGGADGILCQFSETQSAAGAGSDTGLNKNAVGVELDSYYYEWDCEYGINGKHIAIVKDVFYNHLAYAYDTKVDDGKWHHVDIVYSDGTMKVFLDNVSKLSASVTLPERAYLGMCASTGNGYNLQCVANVSVQSEGIIIDKSSLNLDVNVSADLTCTKNGVGTIEWSSSDEDIVQVTGYGTGTTAKVTGKKVGTAIVTASYNGMTASCKVTVKNGTFALDKTDMTLYINKSEEINCTKDSVGTVIWKSSNEDIAQVIGYGTGTTAKVTGKKEGTATVTASFNGMSVSCKVTVKSDHTHEWGSGTITKTPTCVSKGIRTYNCTHVGCQVSKTEEIAVNPNTHTGNTEYKNKTAATCEKAGYSGDVYCKNCGKKMATGKTISATGHKFGAWKTTKAATALAAGTSARKCTVCGKTETKSIAKLKATIKLSKSSLTLQVKKAYTIKVTYTKGDAVKAWKSSNTKIATVTSKGKITAKKKGKATITVTLKSGKKAAAKVTVK